MNNIFSIEHLIFWLLLLIFTTISCRDGGDINKNSNYFDKSGIPVFVWNSSGNYYLSKPWGYEDTINSGKKFSLVIYLHGSGAQRKSDIIPVFNNTDEKKDYPAFVYLPFTSGSWDNKKLISQIEEIIKSYRIDTDRLYLIGHSMGGSGSYSLANDYYNSKQRLFAAIVRMAGQSQTVLHDSIAGKTSIWYFIGKADTPLRVQIAEEAYRFLKGHSGNLRLKESVIPLSINGYSGKTTILKKSGMDIVRFTEYDFPVGHNINRLPFEDPYLLKWIFSQSLKKR